MNIMKIRYGLQEYGLLWICIDMVTTADTINVQYDALYCYQICLYQIKYCSFYVLDKCEVIVVSEDELYFIIFHIMFFIHSDCV